MSREVYMDLVRTIAKVENKKPNKALLRNINYLIGKREDKLIAALKKIIKGALKKFARKLNNKMFSKVFKDSQSDLKAHLKEMMKDAFGAAAVEEYTDVFSDFMDELIQGIGEASDVNIDYSLVDKKATEWLRNNAENLFSTLSDSQAEGIYNSVADSMAAEGGYTIDTIINGIKNSLLSDATIYLPNQTLSLDQYSELVGRTETSRAASGATQVTAESLGLQSVQFMAQDTACDDCADLDGEIMDSDDDSEMPPIHPNCLVQGTLITTERGDIPVEDIVIGDMVLTHLGRYRRVTHLFINNVEEVLQLTTENHTLRLTGNHPVFHGNRWTSADTLQIGDEVMSVNCKPTIGISGESNQLPTFVS